LNALAPVMQFPQLGNQIASNPPGHRPARIIPQPPSVRRPDEMVSDDQIRPVLTCETAPRLSSSKSSGPDTRSHE
jgi:hypothetical protein